MAEKLEGGYLVAKLKEQRLGVVQLKDKAGDYTLKLRRPTDVEMAELRNRIGGRAVLEFVEGWDGVTEAHMIAGGAGHHIEFSKELAFEWLSDRGDVLPDLVSHVVEAYTEHATKIGLVKKKSRTG